MAANELDGKTFKAREGALDAWPGSDVTDAGALAVAPRGLTKKAAAGTTSPENNKKACFTASHDH